MSIYRLLLGLMQIPRQIQLSLGGMPRKIAGHPAPSLIGASKTLPSEIRLPNYFSCSVPSGVDTFSTYNATAVNKLKTKAKFSIIVNFGLTLRAGRFYVLAAGGAIIVNIGESTCAFASHIDQWIRIFAYPITVTAVMQCDRPNVLV